MLKNITLYHFSPTGGTKKTADMLCGYLGENITEVNLGEKNVMVEPNDSEVAVIAAPVFGGRIPAVVTDKIKAFDGTGKKAITLAVYGTRAYEDALLELNNTAAGCGFEVVASAALIAEHSMVRSVGAGRPDEKDESEICDFVKKVLAKLESDSCDVVEVPGDFPYKDHMVVKATPVSMDNCNRCGLCEKICPTGAIEITEDGVKTSLEKCNLCLACTAHCPLECRKLAPAMQEGLNAKLGPLKDIRRENEFYY